jgi:hypothetical protein
MKDEGGMCWGYRVAAAGGFFEGSAFALRDDGVRCEVGRLKMEQKLKTCS